MKTSVVQNASPDLKALKDWSAQLQSLNNDIKKWAKKEKWLIDALPKFIEEKALGKYEAEVIHLLTAQGTLVVDPIAASIAGAKGRVDFYAFPTLNKVKLLWNGEKWIVRTESGINLKQPWNRKTFVELARDLTSTP